MPAHGAVRVLIDGAFTPGFDEVAGLTWALIWLAGLALAAAIVFHRSSAARTA
jgi:hypothetical protein